jgi:subtilisin family serine protease
MYRLPQSTSPSNEVIEVTYRTAVVTDPVKTIDARAAAFGASKISELSFANIGYATRVLHVLPSNASSMEAALRSQPGITSVAPARRLSAMSVNRPYLGTDPYFDGASGAGAPLYQTDSTGGQWDMHVEELEHAFDYSQANNGSGIVNAGALGSTSVKLAIIDTGEDVTHPELRLADVARTRCFITNESGTQSTGDYVTDPDGHGTDVTGIADASPNNGHYFVGDGGGVALMLYRVFPTPDDSCTNPNSTDPQCSALDIDIASAIDDAVSNGANVISMSLGGNACVTSGGASNGDPSTAEGDAVANAIASKVIVVAASGNGGNGSVSSPACDTDVIAVGASAYNDGNKNGSSYTGSNKEYVASYSQYGTTNTPGSAASWGIVAPGGDPLNDTDQYDLHWIENIWTTTPLDSDFAGSCGTDQFGETGNCLTFIAGTSMATPHVAGAAALVLSVNSSYQSPTGMKTLLCDTADDIDATHQGCGRLNVYRALAKALDDPSPPT